MYGICTWKPDHAIRAFDLFLGMVERRYDQMLQMILVEEGPRAMGAVYWTARLESLLNTISGYS
jgi:hypothetical protein